MLFLQLPLFMLTVYRFFFSSRRRHTRSLRDWSQTCALPILGDSLIYLVDRWRGKNGARDGEIGNIGFYDVDFEPLPDATLNPEGHGLLYIDHLTHNVHREIGRASCRERVKISDVRQSIKKKK